MSVLSIHKEIEKKEYANSPLGKIERQITKIYDEMKLKGEALPESVAKQIYDIRDQNEKEQMAYIEMTLKRDKEAVNEMLLKSMGKELEILINNKSTTNTS